MKGEPVFPFGAVDVLQKLDGYASVLAGADDMLGVNICVAVEPVCGIKFDEIPLQLEGAVRVQLPKNQMALVRSQCWIS